MSRGIRSFGPVARRDARLLILGSIPGEESLRRREYYAHPRNRFWDLMGSLIGAGREWPYAQRLKRLRDRRIALWDVIGACRRQGSLDGNIVAGSVVANDFRALFRRCPAIRCVAFNGRTAGSAFSRLVRPRLEEPLRDMAFVTLPSSSPAHAALSFDEKLARWRILLLALESGQE